MSRTSPILPLIFTFSCSVVCLTGACREPSPAESESAGDSPTCGDGVIDGDETCDDGNPDNDDGCSATCQLETCDDGIAQASETCDDGDDDPTGGAIECGNGVAEAGEGCDDGNTEAGDGCSSTCQLESCGDGLIQGGEECDDGAETPSCDADCTYSTCGDSYTNAQAGEACDDGNLIDTDSCTDDCTLIPPCGDGVVDDGQECDDGPGSATCDADCTVASCGDGYFNAYAGEACDDGNAVNDDTCSNACTIPVCGGGMACGSHLWSKRFGGEGAQETAELALDAAGNVVLTGGFAGSMTMGEYTLISHGGDDVFLAKFSPAGDVMWSKRFGDEMKQTAYAASVDSQGNVVVTGEFSGTMNLGGDPLVSQGKADIFLAKFSPAGEHLWSHRFGDGDSQFGRALAVDGQDNIIVTGNLWGTANLGGGDLVGQGSDFFIAKFSPAGEHLWSQHHGDDEPQTGLSAKLDDQDNIVVAGNLRGTMDLGGGPLTSAHLTDVFVAKLSPAGDHLWSQRFGGDDHQHMSVVALDKQNNVVITGDFYGAVNFGGGEFISAGKRDLFVAKFTPSGEHLWSKSAGDSGDQYMLGTAVEGAGNIVLTGMFAGGMDLGGGAIASQGEFDIFVVKLSGAGDQIWSRRAGDWNNQAGTAAAVDGQGDIVIAGSFASKINLGGEDLVSGGSFDLYLAKLGG